jgi:hypothetical protein
MFRRAEEFGHIASNPGFKKQIRADARFAKKYAKGLAKVYGKIAKA